MASRAPTLIQPKTKPKVATKATLAKSKSGATVKAKSATKPKPEKSTAAVAQATKATSKTLSKNNALKTTTEKGAATPSLKSHAAHTVVAQPKLAKTEASSTQKPPALASGKPAAASLGTASFEPAQPKPRRRTKEVRTRIYWAVFNTDLRRVAVFEFDQRDEAQRRATKLSQTSGEHHFIQKIKAIVQ